MRVVLERTVAVDDVLMLTEGGRTDIHCLCRCGVPCFGGSWSLFASQIFFGESLLPCFGFPIVITNPSSVLHHSAAELSEHGFGRDDGNLPRAV